MEQQPGPVNWAPYNPAPLPGMIRLWTWEAFAHGAEVVSYFRWRQAPFAQEQMHAGLKRPDDKAAPGLAEVMRTAEEMSAMPQVGTGPAPVALIFDYAAAWAWDVLPQGADFDYFRLVFDAYRALRRRGLSVDILPPDTADLSAYKLVLAPGLATLGKDLQAALLQTRCLLGPRTNLITEELGIPTPMGPALPGLDVTVSRVESLPPTIERPVAEGGHVVHWHETLEGDADVLIRMPDGAPLLVGGGQLHYLGGWPDVVLWDRVIDKLGAELGLQTLPEGLRLRDGGSYHFAFNYAFEPLTWRGTEIPPAGVAWWPA
jgi:beta-galactosidase